MSAAKRSLEIEQLEDTINERTVFVHEMLIFFVGVVFGVINLVAHEDRANIISRGVGSAHPIGGVIFPNTSLPG